MVTLREAPIDSKLAKLPGGAVSGCCSAAPGAAFRVRPSNPLIVTYSVHVPCTNTVIGTSFSSRANVAFSDWPAAQFTEIGGKV
jgi:hypothetical protein